MGNDDAMNKIYIIALAIATGLNVFYTIYSYNQMNKWKESVIQESTNEQNSVAELKEEIQKAIQQNEKLYADAGVKYDKLLEAAQADFKTNYSRIQTIDKEIYVIRYKLEDLIYENNNKTVQ
jgi:tRNA C32,U32 (ribose-2'-O)-methylase TrmJ